MPTLALWAPVVGRTAVHRPTAQPEPATAPPEVRVRRHHRSHRHRRKKLLIALAKAVGFVLFACVLLYIWYAMASE
jgi:hypothetical protein